MDATGERKYRTILHIGRHKTGTSSLQKFLYTNKSAMQHLGYYYPESGSQIAHHHVAAYFNRRVRSENGQALSRASTSFRALSEEIQDRSECILLSSEAFQNADPELIAEHFSPSHTNGHLE